MSAVLKPELETQNELEQLQARKQELALEVVGGNEGARVELGDINNAIAALQQEAELRELAAAEQQRRDVEAQKEREGAERAAGLEKLNELRTAQNKRLTALEKQISKLAIAIQEAVDCHRELYGLASGLGVSERWRIKDDITAYLQTALWPALGMAIGYQQPVVRRSLVRGQPRAETKWTTCKTCGAPYPDAPNVKHKCSLAEAKEPTGPNERLKAKLNDPAWLETATIGNEGAI
ncbi:MAG TPA: hypothetical protein VJ180_08560 [Pyrinomonadaceae bacterium]|nr:hypothetical protein [Pyrinomonadaceae bacterium]